MRAILVPAVVLATLTLAGCVGQPPEGLMCEAEDRANELDWDAVEGATSYRIYRFENGNITDFAETEETHFTDDNVTAGVTYVYAVTAVTGRSESAPAMCEVTAVPFFPNPAVVAVALLGSVAGYALWKRRA